MPDDAPEIAGELLELAPDRVVTLAVILVLGITAIAAVIGGLALAADDKAVPDFVIAIGSSAAGAVGGLLARTR